MTTNTEQTHVINRQLLADLPDRLVELVDRDEAAPARSIAVPRLGPNGPKIEKETTHDLLSWKRRASMA